MSEAVIEDLGGGVGRTVCGDCDGTGLFAEPVKLYPCVRCKATGEVFIMFYSKEQKCPVL